MVDHAKGGFEKLLLRKKNWARGAPTTDTGKQAELATKFGGKIQLIVWGPRKLGG
jgi:hypothetical protein